MTLSLCGHELTIIVVQAREGMHRTPHTSVKTVLKALLAGIDLDGDGKISYSEFKGCLRVLEVRC